MRRHHRLRDQRIEWLRISLDGAGGYRIEGFGDDAEGEAVAVGECGAAGERVERLEWAGGVEELPHREEEDCVVEDGVVGGHHGGCG